MMIYKGVRGRAAHIFGVIMLVFLGLVFAMPLYWMISTALKYETYCFTTPPQWFPNPIKWSNFTEIFGRMDMARYIKNTLITSILPVIGTLISCPMVAYSITKIPWKGGKYLFPIILMTMMIPSMVTQIQCMRHGQSWECWIHSFPWYCPVFLEALIIFICFGSLWSRCRPA